MADKSGVRIVASIDDFVAALIRLQISTDEFVTALDRWQIAIGRQMIPSLTELAIELERIAIRQMWPRRVAVVTILFCAALLVFAR